ncbi:MAG: GntR family transcriptional regulator [Chloroflexi bacterium HGW-Chloroflexi-3]|nr:MAG: GntR family transcriptional regulator [Chloroflexi bacterium HGW-Chloroflexi-3]
MTEAVPLYIEIDFRSGIPITDQIVEQIYDRIVLGELRTGEQLPTVRDLARQLKVNFNTVARAYRILDQAGVINTQHGRGTYILPEVPPQETEKSKELDRMIRDFLDQLEGQGFVSPEIQAMFQRNLRERRKLEEFSSS